VSTVRRAPLGPIAFTACVIVLIAHAITEPGESLFKFALIVMVAICVAVLRGTFPGSTYFVIGFANWIGVYACMFEFFRETNFATASSPVVVAAFAMPLVTFLVSALWWREDIRAIVTSPVLREGRRFPDLMEWLLPVGGVGLLSFVVPGLGLAPGQVDLALLGSMAVIAITVAAVSHDVTTFLLDVGLLFEEFFGRIRLLLMPAFAFLTFYSLVVIIFASAYRVLDRLTVEPQFTVDTVARRISFSESLYFSIVTLSTVGYGDILPRTPLIWVMVASEVVCGVLLLLFGFSEIMTHARERRERRGPDVR
jgi:voltage-gated potassium channel